MAPRSGRTAKGKATARAKVSTSGINQHLWLDGVRIKRFISDHICGLIRKHNSCSFDLPKAWDFVYDKISLDPVTTRHISQYQLIWRHSKSRSSPFREWWAAFRSYMGQMFDTTRDPMNVWRCDNLCWQQVRGTCQRSGFGPEKWFGSVLEQSKNPTRSFLAGQTRNRTRQPAGFAGFG
jgi:hypothetical protein